jgi:drug/metabolite transporter (DMT)-like permease
MNPIRKGIIFALLGTLFFSTKAIFVKLAYQHDVDPITLLLLRMLFALPFYGGLAIWYRQKVKASIHLSKRDWILLVITALLGYYVSSFLDFQGLQYIGASLERLILFIFPSFVVILSWILFKERISRSVYIALIFSYVGLLVVFSSQLMELQIGENFWTGTGYILLCAVTFALFYVGNQWLIPKMGAFSFTNISMLIACLAVIIHYTFQVDSWSKLFECSWPVYLYAGLMAFVSTVIPSYFVSYSIQFIGASRSSIISSFGPVSTILLAYLFLDERLSWLQIVGGFIIIVSITRLNINRKKIAKNT